MGNAGQYKLLQTDRQASTVWTISSRYRYHILLTTVFGSSFLFLSLNNNKINFIDETLTHTQFEEDHYDADQEELYTIRTDGCTIPGMKPLAKNIEKYVHSPKNLNECPNSKQPLLQNNITHIWTSNLNHYNISNLENFSCCYMPFYRPDSVKDIYSRYVDDRVQYESCTHFTDTIQANDEFVKVKCTFKGNTLYTQYFVFAVKKQIILHDDVKKAANKNSYNVIILGIDGVSRLNLHRTMPKTVAYVREKGAVELLGYNKIDDNSYPNIVPLLMGYKTSEIKKICHPFRTTTFDFCPFIWHQFKNAGYYTAFGEDNSPLGTFNYLLNGFLRTPTDYYLHTFIREADMAVGTNKDYNCNLCMHDKYFYKVLLDYVDNITTALYSSRLFGFFWEVTMSHDYLNYPMVMDEYYEEFLKRLDASKYLDETILILLSDHGIRYGDIRSTMQGNLEERLPFVIILTPPSFREKYTEAFSNLKLNSRRLTSPFNVHTMLSDLVDLKNIENEKIVSRSRESYALQRDISLFLPIPTNRTCQVADIPDHWCTCHKGQSVSKTNDEVVAAANHLIKYLNILLKDHAQCAQLSLAEVVDATKMVWSFNPDEDKKEYMIVVRAAPGGGVFEATMRVKSGKWTLVGSASRLNLYGNQSHCVHHPQLKLYCYCN